MRELSSILRTEELPENFRHKQSISMQQSKPSVGNT